MKQVLFGMIVLALFALATCSAHAEEGRPNFLLIYVDNLGYGDLGCYGNGTVRTPHIDQLAAEGARLHCLLHGISELLAVARCAMTARHPERNGLNYQLTPAENVRGVGLPLTEKLLPQYLQPQGYACGAFGKWNIGFAAGARPTERGFDEFLGHASGNIHYFKHLYHGQNDLRRGTEPVDLRGRYAPDLFADAAIDFVRRHRERPWLVYLPFNAVHFVGPDNVEPGERVEWQVPARYLALYGYPPEEPDQQKRFRAVLSALDDAIGRVLAAVDHLELRQRTAVFLISDNGAFMLTGRGLEVQSNAPLRDGGVTTYEGGIRIPAIVRWPGRVGAGTLCNEVLSTLDVLPTFLSAADALLPTDRTLDGSDALPVLAGQAPSPHAELHWAWDQGRDQRWQAMRAGPYKIVRRSEARPWELYNLSWDSGEAQDLAAEKPAQVRELAARFERWQASIRNDPTRGISTRLRPPP